MESAVTDHRKAVGGFVTWILTLAGMGAYIIWALVPEEQLHRLGIVYYPDKYWAVAAPAYFAMLFLFYWTTYTLSYMRNTNPLTDMYVVTDRHAKGSKATLGTLADTQSSIPPISDIPVAATSKIFFQVTEY